MPPYHFFYIYILRSVRDAEKFYIGFTRDLRKRLSQHNEGKSTYTKSLKPWRLVYYEAFSDAASAKDREKSLKKNGNPMRELKKRAGLLPKRKSGKGGFSTLEMLIAMSIMVLTLTAIVVVSFGTQGLLIGSETAGEAMKKAQQMLEEQQALGRKDFQLVSSVASTTDGIYEKAVRVVFKDDYLSKETKVVVAWTDERQVPHSAELTTLIANFETPTGGNTCESTPRGNWQSPAIINATTDFATLVGDPAGTYTLWDIDAYQKRLYVVAGNTSAANKETLFVFNIATPGTPTLIGKFDNAPTASRGLAAVRVTKDPVSSKLYAFMANRHDANYATCTPGQACSQLQVADVTSPVVAGWNPGLLNLMLASSSDPFVKGSGGQAVGNSLFFRNGYLLLGLTDTGAGNGSEFHIMDLHSMSLIVPASGSIISRLTLAERVGSFEVNNDINALLMRGNYAYVASPNTNELQTLDVSNPAAPSLVGSFGNGAGNGKSMALVGNTFYLGKTTGAGNDLFILDNTNPASVLPELGGMDVADSVNATIVRDYLTFTLTNSALRIFNTKVPASISSFATLPLPASGSVTEPSMDCEGNYLYAVSNDGLNKGKLYVITAP